MVLIHRRLEFLAGGAFTPASVSGLQLWLSADVGTYQDTGKTTAASSDTDPVGAWEDQSANGTDLTQGTDASRPILRTNVVNGYPVLRGDGAADHIFTATNVMHTDASYTLIIVWAPNDVTDTARTIAGGQFRADNPQQHGTGILYYHNNAATFNAYNAGWYSNGTFNISTFDWTGTTIDTRVDGTVQRDDDAMTTAVSSGQGFYCFARSTPGDYLDGDIAEVIYYSPQIALADLQSVESYLGTKYNISLPF